MGGYAAILFGCKLGVGKVLAFSPQMMLDSRLPNNPHSKHILQYPDVYPAIAAAKNTIIDILFGSEDLCDAYTLIPARQYRSIKLHNVYGSEHNLMHYLSTHGVLSEIMAKYVVSGRINTRLPLSTLHQDSPAMKWVNEAVEAYYFISPAAAIAPLEALVQSVPQWSAAHCWLGMARARSNDAAGAVEALQQATRRLTQNGLPFFELALALTKLGQHSEAESALLRSMQLAPQPTVQHYYWLGISYLLQNKLSAAQQMQEKVLTLDKNFSRAEYQLGLIHSKLGDYLPAVRHFENALTLGDSTPNLKKHLVTALFRSTPEESFDYARAMSLCPEHPLLKNTRQNPVRS